MQKKSNLQTLWHDSSAAWDQWADSLHSMADKFNQPLLHAAKIQTGDWVLDLASGAGEPALSVARAVGESGRVVASDLVPAMLQGTQRRAPAHLHCLAADMAALPFANCSLDKITCRFGIMFCTEWQRAIAECLRVLKPCGRMAFMLWGEMAENTVFHVIRQAAEHVFPDNTAYAHEFLPFSFADTHALTVTMKNYGLQCDTQLLEFTPKVPTHVKFWQAPMEMSFNARYQAATVAQRVAWEQAILEQLVPYMKDNMYHLKVKVLIVVGEKVS